MSDKGGASTSGGAGKNGKRKLRSSLWFDNPDNPGMTALYIERYLNFGLTPAELRSGKPIIGIAQTGSDLSPCNRHHLELAKRVRDGILAAGGVPFEFPVHPIQETGKRPTAALDRNLAYLGLVEVLYGYFIDGVVLTTGCDKTTPACIMAAATVNLPAIVLSGGPMNNGWHHGERTGSGTVVWRARSDLAEGKIDYEQFMEIVTSSAPSVGHCNTMGTASTMNGLAEALGMSLPGCAAIPAPHRERGQIAYETGKRIVDMVWEDLKPSDILTRQALENAIIVNSAIGGSTNAPIHINAIARHIGVDLDVQDWETVGHKVPLLVNMQPAGKYLGEEFHRAGGVPAVVFEGPEDYHHRIDDPALKIDENCMLFIRGTVPIGYPGGADVVNMQPPAALIKQGVNALPCIGDGRQSGTSGSPSILNASPEAAAGGGLALLKTGDRVRIDLKKRTANILIPEAELHERRAQLQAHPFAFPASQTPWQQIQRDMVAQFDEGMVLKPAVQFQRLAQTAGVPRDNH